MINRVINSSLFSRSALFISYRMNSFTSIVSPMTGKCEWVLEIDQYNYYQEIARSGYADMLHDEERNKKYYGALRKAIQTMHKKGERADVLDIGTGTGLLSMMAARSGADSVVACEAFAPMAKCAKEIIKQNGFENLIKIIPKRSTDIEVGSGGDMDKKANILVTEVFDTELIGEGAIGTFSHAHKYLLKEDCIVIPSAANMYVQVVHSDLVNKWSRLAHINIPGHGEIQMPSSVSKYDGSASLHDLQLDQLPRESFTALSDPLKAFHFDYSGKTSCNEKSRKSIHKITANMSGTCHAIFMWWDLQMDTNGDIMLSCAPRWAHPDPGNMQWRDHWMQAIFYPKTQLSVNKGDMFHLSCEHDEYSLFFDVAKEERAFETISKTPNNMQLACNRSRLGMLNDSYRNMIYIQSLKQNVKKDSICLCLSDGSLLPVMAATLGANKVYTVERSRASADFMNELVRCNSMDKIVTVIQKDPCDLLAIDIDNNKISLVLSEPYFYTSLLPWHNLYFWYTLTSLKEHMSEDVKVLPGTMKIKAIGVNFKDLWKIRSAVGICEGFDISEFDKLVLDSANVTDDAVEPQPLWEYPGIAMTEPFTLITNDLTKPVTLEGSTEVISGSTQFKSSGQCNGVAIWAEYDFNGSNISHGPIMPTSTGENISWDSYTRQGVYLYPSTSNVCQESVVTYIVKFNKGTGNIDFQFKICDSHDSSIS